MISGGVPASANSPSPFENAMSGRPNSVVVGISLRVAQRVGCIIANPRNFPLFILGAELVGESNIISTWPASKSVDA